MSTGDPGYAAWAGQTVWRVHQSVMIDTPLIPPPGSQPWAAVLWPDPRVAGGWGRAMMAPGPNGRGFAADRLTPGDVIEFGADYRRQTSRKHFETIPHRWYGVVMATAHNHVVGVGPFPGPEPARQFADRALEMWRQSVLADTPGLPELPAPAPALPTGRTGQAPTVEVRTNGEVTRVDDPTHGRLVVDAAVFGAAMATDTAQLVGVLRDAHTDTGQPELTGAEPKATLAALVARHAPDQVLVDAEVVTAAPDPEEHTVAPAVTGSSSDRLARAYRSEAAEDSVYYGHPDGSVERVLPHAGQKQRTLRPYQRWTPDGFSWGYSGDGPTELAFALLLDASGDRDTASRLAARYADAVIAHLPQGQAWSLPVDDVRSWLQAAEQEKQPPIPAAGRTARSRRNDMEIGL
jgi:hypothetical protein